MARMRCAARPCWAKMQATGHLGCGGWSCAALCLKNFLTDCPGHGCLGQHWADRSRRLKLSIRNFSEAMLVGAGRLVRLQAST